MNFLSWVGDEYLWKVVDESIHSSNHQIQAKSAASLQGTVVAVLLGSYGLLSSYHKFISGSLHLLCGNMKRYEMIRDSYELDQV